MFVDCIKDIKASDVKSPTLVSTKGVVTSATPRFSVMVFIENSGNFHPNPYSSAMERLSVKKNMNFNSGKIVKSSNLVPCPYLSENRANLWDALFYFEYSSDRNVFECICLAFFSDGEEFAKGMLSINANSLFGKL